MKTSTRLNEVERKYIVAALNHFLDDRAKGLEIFIVKILIRKINSGIRYDRPTIKATSHR